MNELSYQKCTNIKTRMQLPDMILRRGLKKSQMENDIIWVMIP